MRTPTIDLSGSPSFCDHRKDEAIANAEGQIEDLQSQINAILKKRTKQSESEERKLQETLSNQNDECRRARDDIRQQLAHISRNNESLLGKIDCKSREISELRKDLQAAQQRGALRRQTAIEERAAAAQRAAAEEQATRCQDAVARVAELRRRVRQAEGDLDQVKGAGRRDAIAHERPPSRSKHNHGHVLSWVTIKVRHIQGL
ncbi:hypothetical protein PAPYR_11226 [Paratrimastix pyriformis]|uniref:Uncharacterized protein n=1 Tax=Paratrimastix pyriformis TaxID=342808 RepID=A0ABQ8U738_9EUKA|nr:hypothetical protein PAPYR_11226 [Paratrimastix pyriformis]